MFCVDCCAPKWGMTDPNPSWDLEINVLASKPTKMVQKWRFCISAEPTVGTQRTSGLLYKNIIEICALSSENDLDPKIYLVNNILPTFSNIEEMFIDRIHVVMKVFKLEKGAIGYKGNTLNIQKDLQLVIDKLPLVL